MTTETTQPVAGDASAQGTTPVASAENAGGTKTQSLEDILAEFSSTEETTPPVASKPDAKPSETQTSKPAASVADPELKAIRDELNALKQVETRKHLDALYGRLRGDSNVDPDLVESYVNLKAQKNPQLAKAWMNRDSNPEAWLKVESQLGKDIRAKFGGGGLTIDHAVTETKEAVAAAVRGASTAAKQGELSDKDVMNMSRAEFDALQRKMGVRP